MLRQSPMEDIHDTDSRSQFLLNLWCIVDKSIRKKTFKKLVMFSNLLEMIFQIIMT
jgi:hypothetical protein